MVWVRDAHTVGSINAQVGPVTHMFGEPNEDEQDFLCLCKEKCRLDERLVVHEPLQIHSYRTRCRVQQGAETNTSRRVNPLALALLDRTVRFTQAATVRETY